MQTKCQLCGQDVTDPGMEFRDEAERNLIVDGKTRIGPWAWMCKPCHRYEGLGLGTGKGQVFNVLTGKKVEG